MRDDLPDFVRSSFGLTFELVVTPWVRNEAGEPRSACVLPGPAKILINERLSPAARVRALLAALTSVFGAEVSVEPDSRDPRRWIARVRPSSVAA